MRKDRAVCGDEAASAPKITITETRTRTKNRKREGKYVGAYDHVRA